MRSEVTQISADLSSNMALQSEAGAVADREELSRERLKQASGRNHHQCELQTATLRSQSQLVEKDLKQARRMMDLAGKCKQGASFLQKKGGTRSSVQQLHESGQRLGSALARRDFRRLARRAAGCDHQSPKNVSRNTAGSLLATAAAASHDLRDWPGRADAAGEGMRRRSTGCELNVTDEVQCGVFHVELHRMVGRLESQFRSTTADLRRVADLCQSREELDQTQFEETQGQQAKANEEFSQAMGSLADIQASRDAKMSEQGDIEEDMHSHALECKKVVAALDAEFSSLMRSRQAEIERRSNSATARIQDCEVSPWVFSICSRTCRARQGEPGYTQGTRTVLLPAGQNGMPCPPLKAVKPCGTVRCPEDCELGPWQSWTSCNKRCGGGMQSRERELISKSDFGGRACPVAVERRLCNVDSCDTACKLDEWTEWSPCSRACRFSKDAPTGRQRQSRKVLTPAQGLGSCPRSHSRQRFRVRRCNDQPCPQNATCAAPQDVILLLSGSAQADFRAQLDLSRYLIERSTEAVRFGVAAYGGSAKVLAALGADHPTLLAALRSATAPGGDADLGQGAAVARNLLSTGSEPGRQSTVLLITDGAPTQTEEALTEARRLRELGARLIVGTVDDRSPTGRRTACSLASTPCAMNVEAVDSWALLSQQPGQLLSVLCTRLEQSTASAAEAA